MLKKVITTLCAFVAIQAQASNINDITYAAQQSFLSYENIAALDFRVGDTASYNLKAGFVSGKTKMTVTAVNGTEVTLSQEIDLGFLGKQDCVMVLDSSTGETKSLVCNGQNQDPGAPGDIELIEMKEDQVRVPAGTFTAVYIKAKRNGSEIIEQWANISQIPVFGMIKSIAPSQMGQVVIELTSYRKQN